MIVGSVRSFPRLGGFSFHRCHNVALSHEGCDHEDHEQEGKEPLHSFSSLRNSASSA